MFNFSELPFCTSYFLPFNGERVEFNLNITQYNTCLLEVQKVVELALNIEQNNTIIL